MAVAFQSPVTSANTNAAFMDKNTLNTSTVAIVALNNTVPSSGPSIVNAQLEINKTSQVSGANQSVVNGNQITLTDYKNNFFLVQGNGAPAVMNVVPFVGTFYDGQEVVLSGLDATNTLSVIHNDASNGCLLNGNATIGLNETLMLRYVSSISRWVEIARSF